jgi:tRNA(Ile)-lysidine synthase
VWNDFEHRTWKKIKDHDLDQKKLILTISGGLDSMALLTVVSNLNVKNIQVLHFHHGDFENKKYRDQALGVVQNFCQNRDIPFQFEKSAEILKSEAEFRTARIRFFNHYKTSDSIFVTGHHLDDVLETRLIKMIRGSGAEGLKSFLGYNGETFRPFLDISKKEIFEYASGRNIKWVDDPTNIESDYLRNWIRNQWLPALNAKQTGGVLNLAKSLDRLLLNLESQFETEITYHPNEVQMKRLWFFSLSTKDQLKVLSICMGYFKKIEFSVGQLKEINKRLDKNQKEHIFEMLGVNWVLNAQQIMLRFNSSST